MSERRRSGAALGVVVALGAVLAVALHRNGHSQGDDFALYLRQARSLFDGDPAQVVADNRYAVINSGGAFSPIAYPWGLPLLLAPFVHTWGLDYDRLKLVIVAAFCVWLVLVHGVVRRRVGRLPALAITLVVATVPVLLVHTDSLLSEFPQAASVAVLIWWLDRIHSRRRLLDASTRDLVVTGLLVAVAFNIRRESLVLIGAVGVVQLVELGHRWWRSRPRPSPTGWPWRALVLPHATFAVAVVLFQLLLPSMLLPSNADSGPKHIDDRLQQYPRFLAEHLGLFPHHAIGLTALALALIGVAIGVRKRPGLDGPLAAVAICSLIAVSTHFRFVSRYYFQVLPWVLYFGTVTVLATAQWIAGHWPRAATRRAALAIGVAPLLVLLGVHANKLPSRIAAAQKFNDDGRQQVGPTNPDVAPVYEAVVAYTDPDDVILFFRARTMTLLTDRRAIQIATNTRSDSDVDRAERRADYFAMQRWSDYFEPDLDELGAIQRGYQVVWQDENWILYDLHP